MEEEKSSTSARNFDLSSFAKAKEKMIATNETAYKGLGSYSSWRECIERYRPYTTEEIANIIESGSLTEQQKLSRNYFYKDGYYKQIIIYYATLLKYAGLLIPNPSAGKNLSTSHIQKRYYSAMDFVERMNLPVVFTNCGLRALIDGCYYGVRISSGKDEFALIDLPAAYCCSRFKDSSGNDLIEFDLTYFDSITDEASKKAALAAYPKEVASAYKKFHNGKLKTKWFILPSEIGVCFPLFGGRPLFLSVIPRTIEYDEAVEAERERNADEVRKIIVQQIPHLTDGRLLFEPDEAEEMHAGAVGMLKGNKNLSVLTTYGDVQAITSKTAADNADEILTKIEQNIYAQAGVSGQIFAATNNNGLDTSLKNDLALMMYLANKFSAFVSNLLNTLFSNSNITFKYTFLPISYYNQSEFVDSSFKLVGSGYSFLMPAIAMGLSQKDLSSVKDLENDVLKLDQKLRPLATAYTQSGDGNSESKSGTVDSNITDPDEGGRPQKLDIKKSERTLENENSGS